MSLTETSGVFASAHESALNDVVVAITSARPHLLSYGSPAFTPASTVNDTQMPAIGFPGTGGIEWHVRFSPPEVDLYDQDTPLPPQLTLPKGALSVHTKVELCVDCTRGGATDTGKPDPANRDDRRWQEGKGRTVHPLCCVLEIFAVGHLVGTTADGQPAVALALDAVEIVDIAPDDLESVLECLLGTILRAVLATIRLPLAALRAGMFTLTPTQLPAIDADTVSIRGNL
jgi:hypothetical protein